MASLPDLLPLAGHAFFRWKSREVRTLRVRALAATWSAEDSSTRRLPVPFASRAHSRNRGSAAQGKEGALCSNPWCLQEAQQEAGKELKQDKMFSCFKD